MRAAVSFGSNLGDREANLRRAVAALAGFPATRLAACSSVVETDPVDVPAEFASLKFLNCAAIYDTDLDPFDFSRRMHAVEDAMGRRRTVRNGPRTIDIDLVTFGDMRIDTPDLVLPHPRAAGRDFVAKPLAELGIKLEKET